MIQPIFTRRNVIGETLRIKDEIAPPCIAKIVLICCMSDFKRQKN